MDINAALEMFGALAHPTRLDSFRQLVRHEPEGMPAGELAQALGVPQNTLSTHLAILTRAGLTSAERRGRSVIYRASPAGLHALTEFMLRDCCGGRTTCAPAPTDKGC